ncbi:MAG TPA: hypothetical protein VFR81_27050, partial [Longimicrobium sp.]|nr:hypothetical protein [Longimicrobium sp.]
MRIRIATLPLLALGLGVPPNAAGQGTESVPEELVRALLYPYVHRGEAPPSIVAGRLPDEIPAGVLPSGSIQLIGGVSHPRGHSRAVLNLPGAPAEAITGYRTQLERAGWRRSPHPDFAQAPGRLERVFGLCGVDGTLLVAFAAPRPGGGSTLQLSVMRGETARAEHPSYCHGATPEHIDDSLLPPLRGPDGARGGSSGSSQALTVQERHVRLVTTLTPVDLAAHYAGQLREAGWTVGAPVGVGASATVRIERRDARERPWHGVVAATAVADSQRDVVVRVASAEPPPPPTPEPAAWASVGTLSAALARVLAGRPGADGTIAEPEMAVGRLPRGLPDGALPPGLAGAVVLGGATYPDHGIAIVIVPDPPAQGLARYRAEMERTGWRRTPRVDLLERHPETGAGEYCGPDGAFLFVSAIERGAGGSYLRLEGRSEMAGPCRSGSL